MNVFRNLVAAALMLAAACLDSSSALAVPAPLEGRVGPVVVKGESLPAAFLGAPLSRYRVLADLAGAGLAPVPYQIDERDAGGELLPTHGPKARPDDDRSFDATDEVAMMAWDLGVRVDGPVYDGCEAWVEIAVPDPELGAKGYAYLARCSDPPSPSDQVYVKWDPVGRIASTSVYELGYKQPVYYYDHIKIYDGPDILDRLKLRTTFGLGPLRYTIDEEFFIPDVGGYTAGSVRVIYFNRCFLGLGPFGKVPLGGENYFYRDYVFMEVLIDVAFNPAVMGLYYEVGTIADFAIDRTQGYRMCAQAAPACVPITGQTTPAIEELTSKEINWNGIAGPDGAYISWIVLDPDLRTRSTGFYVDDDHARREPEYVPGSSPEIGFKIVDWAAAEPGTYYFHIYHAFMREYGRTQLDKFERAIYKPLKAEAKGL